MMRMREQRLFRKTVKWNLPTQMQEISVILQNVDF